MLRFLDLPIVGPLVPILVVAGAWEAAHSVDYLGFFPAFMFPPPTKILAKLGELTLNGALGPHVAASLERVITGYAIAVGTAVPLGLLLGWYRPLYKIMEPIIELFRPLPAIGLLAFGVLVFGIGSAPIIFITSYGCFFILFIAALYGIYSVDETMVLVIRSMKGTDRDIFRNVVVPSSLPYIFGGLRQSLATAWILVVAGEMVIGSEGLGYYIVEAQRTFRIPSMYATLALLGILGYASARLLLVVERKWIRWRTSPGKRSFRSSSPTS